MKTNSEKYDFYYNEINKAEEKFIEASIKDKLTEIYEVTPNGTMKKWRVKYKYSNIFYQEDKPTRKEVASIKSYSEDMPEMNADNIGLSLEYYGEYKSSCYIKISDLTKYHLSYELAEIELKRVLLQNETEKYLLDNGYIKCAYCGKIVRDLDAVDHTIIFQGWNGYKKDVMRKTNKYCPGSCGGYDQMAHEG